jgi:hypothetical protein
MRHCPQRTTWNSFGPSAPPHHVNFTFEACWFRQRGQGGASATFSPAEAMSALGDW